MQIEILNLNLNKLLNFDAQLNIKLILILITVFGDLIILIFAILTCIIDPSD
jgi:hypothetical protein